MIRDALAPTSFTSIMCIFRSCCLTPSSVLLYSYFLTDAKFKVIPLGKKSLSVLTSSVISEEWWIWPQTWYTCIHVWHCLELNGTIGSHSYGYASVKHTKLCELKNRMLCELVVCKDCITKRLMFMTIAVFLRLDYSQVPHHKVCDNYWYMRKL